MEALVVKETALILTDTGELSDDDHITKVLRFFGISSRVMNTSNFFTGDHAIIPRSSKVRLFCSSDSLCKLIEELDRNPGAVRLWGEHVHSAFVYAGNDVAVLQKVARRIMSSEHTSLIQMDRGLGEWTVSDTLPQFCGPMSGLRIPVGKTASAAGLVRDGGGENAPGTTLDGRSTVFFKADYQAVPVFLSTTSKIVDVDAEIGAGNFDIKDHFLSATPIVMFVKWAFADLCWKSPEVSACLVIDDPLLSPQYGFLNYQDLLNQMERHNFATNIAFIPWNWRRSSSKVAELFKNNPTRYSLSMHGCDHTGGEFGTQDMESLVWKSHQAIDRMSCHESKTGLRHDRVMVFPQGVFSSAAMRVLKHTQYTAAVNTEVLSTDPRRPTIRTSDVWDVAVMNYSSFPIFTRRYPSQGVENFAFDILLGKPCIVVIHHDSCRDQSAHLVEFVNRLNGLNCRLSWRSLGEVVRRSCRQREISPSLVETEMYGSELRLENRSEQQRRFCITKRELDASAVKEVYDGSRPIPWTFSEGRICFEIKLAAGRSTTIGITFHDYSGAVRCQENLSYKLKTMLRRYLSETRDNYVAAKQNLFPWAMRNSLRTRKSIT